MVASLQNPNVFTDLGGLNSISRAGRENSAEGLKQVAQQFESLFLNMVLKSMRDTTAVFSEDNYLSSNEMSFHQENFDNQLSLHLSENGGIGLADVLYRQMMGQFQVPENGAVPGPASNDDDTFKMPGKDDHSHAVPDAVSAESDAIESPEVFVSRLYPMAERAAGRIGVEPELLLAQAALETGWGRKVVTGADGSNSHNLFGIKADSRWNGDTALVHTVEYRDGLAQREQARFRSYESYEASFNDYVDFLQDNPRYQSALQHGREAETFVQSLQAAGYATDPIYAEKVTGVMNSNVMQLALSQRL